jgi:hypothetical protein
MFKRLDIIGGIVGCLGGVVLAGTGYVTAEAGTLEIGVAVLVASAIYLLFRKRMVSSSEPSLAANRPLTLIIHIVFFASFAASVYLTHSFLFRPQLYYILTSICVATVAVGVLSANGRAQTWVLLLEILLIAFSLRFGLLYELPSLYGVDPWRHMSMVEEWASAGHISHITEYFYTEYADFPVMHLNIMVTRIITLLSPKDSYYLSIGLFYVASIMFVFLLGRSLINTKIGLLAALLISINMSHISWGVLLVPASFGVCIFIAICWLSFKGTFNLPFVLILIAMSVVLMFTHPLAALATAVALSLFYIANGVYRRVYKTDVEKMNIRFNFVVLFWVLMLATWINASYSAERSLFESVFGALVNSLRTEVEVTGTAFEPSATPLGPLNRIGFLIFISIIVIGALSWLWQKAISSKRAAILTAILGLAVITFVLPFINIGNLFSARWLLYVSVLGVVVAVQGIMALSRLLRGRVMKSLGIVLILFIISMFMINSHAANTLTPFYGKDYVQDPDRGALFASELSALETFVETYDGPITVDTPCLRVLKYGIRVGRERAISFDIAGGKEGLIVVRKYSHTHPVVTGWNKAEYSRLLASFEGSGYNMVYSNGEVKAYLENLR